MLFFKLALSVFVMALVKAKPGLKQGGAACIPEQNYCQNGGTCYTQYTQQPVTVTFPSTTTTTTQPACVPPVATTTEACIPPVVYTTQPPTQPPTTTQYIWVTEPVCGCQPEYVGNRCEQPVTAEPSPPVTTQAACVPFTEAPAVVSACAAIQCLNGGSCREINIQPYGICV